MISLKIISEFCLIKCNFASFSADLLPKIAEVHQNFIFRSKLLQASMADSLHKAINSLSLQEDEDIVLPDSPQFRVFDKNSISLLGRLLNPDCQPMDKMIEAMPRIWRIIGRVRGIALSRDRFQFIFEREEDLQTVLKDRPWSFNHWTMLLERWTAAPPADFLSSFYVWIRIRNIPVNHYTVETMDRLARAIGRVDEIAYDPKVSQLQDYVRARVLFDANSPAKSSRNLTIEATGERVAISFEYEQLRKRCFHCERLTHEKALCPFLKKPIRHESNQRWKLNGDEKKKALVEPSPPSNRPLLEGPPGFPPLFPGLSKADNQAAMLYIAHSDPTERQARIVRVQQSMEDNTAGSSVSLPKITHDVDKGKGHVFEFMEESNRLKRRNLRGDGPICSDPGIAFKVTRDDKEKQSLSVSSPFTAHVSTGFRFGSSMKASTSGNRAVVKKARRRPQSWKRKARQAPLVQAEQTHEDNVLVSSEPKMKRKADENESFVSNNKSPKTQEKTVASDVKPLQA